MGAVYSVCGSATMTLAGDVLPAAKITEGISRFAFTVSIGMAVGPYFLVAGMLVSKLSTQKVIDAGRHRMLVYISLAVLILTMLSYLFLNSGIHLLAAGFFFGLGYGILQPLFQAFVTGTTPAPQRSVANAAYMLSYDVGIGIGSLLRGFMQESIGLPLGFALTAIAYAAGGVVYLSYVDGYYRRLRQK